MNSDERLHGVNRGDPGSFFGDLAQIFLLSLPPNRKRLDDAIGSCGKTIAGRLAQRAQRIGCKNAIVSTLLHDFQIAWPPELLPNLRELGRQQFSKELPNADIGKKIAPPADVRPPAGIITVLRMIKC